MVATTSKVSSAKTVKEAAKTVKDTVKRFKALRLSGGLSHEALAQRAGVTRAAISLIESGKRRPSLLVALRIAAALDTNLSTVLKAIAK